MALLGWLTSVWKMITMIVELLSLHNASQHVWISILELLWSPMWIWGIHFRNTICGIALNIAFRVSWRWLVFNGRVLLVLQCAWLIWDGFAFCIWFFLNEHADGLKFVDLITVRFILTCRTIVNVSVNLYSQVLLLLVANLCFQSTTWWKYGRRPKMAKAWMS